MSAELMKSKFVRRPSICGIDYLWSYCMDFCQILVVASPGPYARRFFFSFLKKKSLNFFLRILFLFVNMGPNRSENGSQKFWNLSWIFLPMVLTKLGLVGFLKFWVSDL